MTREVYNIAIAEDHAMVRQGFVRALSDRPGLRVVIEAKDGIDLLRQLETVSIDIVVLDIVMPVLDGMATIERIRALKKNIKILVVSAQDDHNLIAKYVKLGAHGFLPKTGEIFELLRAIEEVISTGHYFARDILLVLLEKGINHLGGGKQLTPIELSVLKLLCDDLSYQEIAYRLFLGKNDIGYYRTRILHKTSTADNYELKDYAKFNIFL